MGAHANLGTREAEAEVRSWRPETLGVFVLLSFVLKMGGQEVGGQLITEHVSIQTPCTYKCMFECVCVHV